MTLQELLEAIDDLSMEDVQKVQEHIAKRNQSEMIQANWQHQIDAILANVTPVHLPSGTMNVEKLETAIQSIREGLTQDTLNAIADAMDEEFIKPEK